MKGLSGNSSFHWFTTPQHDKSVYFWTASSEFGTYRLCEQQWLRQACTSAQSRRMLEDTNSLDGANIENCKNYTLIIIS